MCSWKYTPRVFGKICLKAIGDTFFQWGLRIGVGQGGTNERETQFSDGGHSIERWDPVPEYSKMKLPPVNKGKN